MNKQAITIRINQYFGPSIEVTFIGDCSPNGYRDYRIVDAFTKQIVPGNTGWHVICILNRKHLKEAPF